MNKQWCEYCESWEAGHNTRHCPTSYEIYLEVMAKHKAWLESQKTPPKKVEDWPEWLVPTGDGHVQKATKKIVGD